MTVDASRSCLGLGTCVGAATRQIVDARVLLNRGRASGLARQERVGWFAGAFLRWDHGSCDQLTVRHAPGDGPDEACQLTSDRGSDDIGRLAAAGELAIARAQPQLRFPGDLADRPGLRL